MKKFITIFMVMLLMSCNVNKKNTNIKRPYHKDFKY